MILAFCSSNRGAGRRGDARASRESSSGGRARLRARWWRELEGSCPARGGRADGCGRVRLWARGCVRTAAPPPSRQRKGRPAGWPCWLLLRRRDEKARPHQVGVQRRRSFRTSPEAHRKVVTRSLRGVDAGPLIPCLAGAPCPCPFPPYHRVGARCGDRGGHRPVCVGRSQPQRPQVRWQLRQFAGWARVRWVRRRYRGGAGGGQPRAGELWAAAAEQPLTHRPVRRG